MAESKRIPVEEWIPHIKSDSADYLDGPRPIYSTDGLSDETKAKLAEQEKKADALGAKYEPEFGTKDAADTD